jgi:hypothetical protein
MIRVFPRLNEPTMALLIYAFAYCYCDSIRQYKLLLIITALTARLHTGLTWDHQFPQRFELLLMSIQPRGASLLSLVSDYHRTGDMAIAEPRPWDLDRHVVDGISDSDRPGMSTYSVGVELYGMDYYHQICRS